MLENGNTGYICILPGSVVSGGVEGGLKTIPYNTWCVAAVANCPTISPEESAGTAHP